MADDPAGAGRRPTGRGTVAAMSDLPVPDTATDTRDQLAVAVCFGVAAIASLRDDVEQLGQVLTFFDDSGSPQLGTDAIVDSLVTARELAVSIREDVHTLLAKMQPLRFGDVDEDTVQSIGHFMLALAEANEHQLAETMQHVLMTVARRGDVRAEWLRDAIVRLTRAYAPDPVAPELRERSARDVLAALIDPVLTIASDKRLGDADMRNRLRALFDHAGTVALVTRAIAGVP